MDNQSPGDLNKIKFKSQKVTDFRKTLTLNMSDVKEKK